MFANLGAGNASLEGKHQLETRVSREEMGGEQQVGASR